MDRAYSVFDVKDVDDEARRLIGWATTPSPDRVGDVVVPEGAQFSLPIPLLWQHDARQPIGQVVEAKVSRRGIEIAADIAKGVSDEIDRAWKLIRAGLVRGLSIGFRGVQMEQIPNSWGTIFEKWEWLELSAVTIPANAEATIQTIKHFDTAALGQTQATVETSAGYPVVAANGKGARVVRLHEPARDRAQPFVIRKVRP